MKIYTKNDDLKALIKEKTDYDLVDNKKDCNVLISGRFGAYDYHEGLEYFIAPQSGLDNIDVDLLNQKNVRLFSVTNHSVYVAEKAVSLALALLGKVTYYHENLKQGNWSDRGFKSRIPWESITKKTIGIYGYGNIGKIIHKMLSGFTDDFYTIDRNRSFEGIKTVKNLTNLVQVCDVIFIATPLNDETRSSFDHRLLSRMQDIYLINVARGRIVNEEDLYNALKDKTLKGYASDVWYHYPKKDENIKPSIFPLEEFNNVVMSNHSGGFSTSSINEIYEEVIRKLDLINNKNFNEQIN